jgi:hypothetical protein
MFVAASRSTTSFYDALPNFLSVHQWGIVGMPGIVTCPITLDVEPNPCMAKTLAQEREEIEQEFAEWKELNPDWRTNVEKASSLLSFYRLLGELQRAGNTTRE